MIYHEVAIEPDAVCSVEDFGLLQRMFGYEHGRLIAFMPAKPKQVRDWPTLLYESLKGKTPGKAKDYELAIKSLVTRCTRRSRNNTKIEPGQTWIDLARSEHIRREFDAILCAEPGCSQAPEYSFYDLHMPPETFPTFLREAVHVGSTMKDPASFLTALRPLICTANRLTWIDAYFDPTPVSSPEPESPLMDSIWLKSFKNLAKELRENSRTIIDIEIHTKTPEDRNSEEFVKSSLALLKAWVPSTTNVKLTSWSEKHQGQRFHARYLLTDKGGAGFEYGTDMRMNQRTDVALLPHPLISQRLDEFDSQSKAPTLYSHDFSLAACGTRST
jgi:hypothetical protein